MLTYHIEMRSYRAVGWFCLVGFAGAAFAAYRNAERTASFFLFLFALLGAYVVLAAGSFDIDEAELRHQSAFGRWRITWEQITAAEFGEGNGTLVFTGGNKRFVLSPPAWWGGREKHNALQFVLSQLERRKLELRPNRTADYKIMKNTRCHAAAA